MVEGMKKNEKCFYCDGTGKIQYRDNSEVYTCTVCNGSGISYFSRYKNRYKGTNKCKYCGRLCFGYACNSCQNTFESEKEQE